MTVRTFGRKASSGGDDMAQRVEAFVAAERARKAQASQAPAQAAEQAVAAGPIYVREKSVAVAYLLWFLFGAISAHRFYLGYPTSALVQMSMWIVGWMMVLGMFVIGLLILAAAGLWVLSDAFLIPHLTRQANERARNKGAAYAFA